jgi:hypothetical protein
VIESTFELGNRVQIGGPVPRLMVLMREWRPDSSTNDGIVSQNRIAVDGEHRPSKERANCLKTVPPAIMIAGSKNLSSRQTFEPFKVWLKVAMIPGHRDIAGNQHQIARRNDLTPVALDRISVIAPSHRVLIAGNRPRK